MDISSYIRNNRIEIIENLMGVSLKKNLLKKYNVTTKTGHINTIITSSEESYLKLLEIYFSYHPKLINNTSNLIVDISNLMYDDPFLIISRKGEIIFGRGHFEEQVYVYKDVHIVKHQSSGYVKIMAPDIKSFKESLFLISKVIESAIVEQHINLGYLPIHGNIVKKEDEIFLIIGESQSGKTNYSERLDGYSLISDEIFLMSSEEILPIITYKKEYISSGHGDNVEIFNGIYRKVSKLDTYEESFFKVQNLKKIILIYPHNDEDICKKISQEEKSLILNEYLLKYPLNNFIRTDISNSLILRISNVLSSISLYIYYRKEALNV